MSHPDLELALELADVADGISLARYRAHDLVIETKPDRTPVTEADKAVEVALRDVLAGERPGHAVLGEEDGVSGDPDSPWRWIIDPIDGTANYLRGIPVWATLIALEHAGEMVVGVVSAPAMGHRWWASRGDGAFADGQPIRVSNVAAIEDAQLSSDGFDSWERHGGSDAFMALVRRCWRTRGFGDFWQHMLVAEGAVDIVLEPAVSLWDLAAIQIIVEEAGGRFTDLTGAPRADGGTACSTNGLLHQAVLDALA
ncbi:MAG TPA: histidinol-phosphatase [Acidimicrobiales bacterium]|nr:histidinol-phosphatase [Acidimicrobiales bacterium]